MARRKAHRFRTILLAAGASLLAASALAASTSASAQRTAQVTRPMADAPYWNAALPVEQRVADLLARMTLEEKIAQITTVWTNKTQFQDAQNRFDPAKATAIRPNGIGQIARPSDPSGPASPRVVRRRSIEDSVA